MLFVKIRCSNLIFQNILSVIQCRLLILFQFYSVQMNFKYAVILEFDNELNKFICNLNNMIEAIHKYNHNIKIVINLLYVVAINIHGVHNLVVKTVRNNMNIV